MRDLNDPKARVIAVRLVAAASFLEPVVDLREPRESSRPGRVVVVIPALAAFRRFGNPAGPRRRRQTPVDRTARGSSRVVPRRPSAARSGRPVPPRLQDSRPLLPIGRQTAPREAVRPAASPVGTSARLSRPVPGGGRSPPRPSDDLVARRWCGARTSASGRLPRADRPEGPGPRRTPTSGRVRGSRGGGRRARGACRR